MFTKLLVLIFLALLLNGCFMTKAVTMPLRVSGAVTSIIPVIGNQVDHAIDTAADAIDEIPL